MNRKLKIVLLATASFALFACTAETYEERSKLYVAWCKTHSCQDLSEEEWQLLRKNHMLPGQVAKNTSTEDAVLAGAVAGSIANAGRR